jgi:hypothetical protein
MGRPNLFRQDFGQYGENEPRRFTFLVRPTLEEFNEFVLLLDKMLSDNLNKISSEMMWLQRWKSSERMAK